MKLFLLWFKMMCMGNNFVTSKAMLMLISKRQLCRNHNFDNYKCGVPTVQSHCDYSKWVSQILFLTSLQNWCPDFSHALCTQGCAPDLVIHVSHKDENIYVSFCLDLYCNKIKHTFLTTYSCQQIKKCLELLLLLSTGLGSW